VRFDRLAFLQPDQLRVLHALAADVGALYASVSTLPPLESANTHTLLPGPGKREWEIDRAGYLSWASAQLVQHAKKTAGSALESASVEEARGAISKENVSAALRALEDDDS